MTGGETFSWERTDEVLRPLAGAALEVDERRRAFIDRDGGLLVAPPPVLPIADGIERVDQYLDDLPHTLGRHLVVLLQAGATALGTWDAGALVRHKVIKKYVVRGKGRAQPAHLKTRGRSRYGSRLRLQNWKRQLVRTNETLRKWLDADGPPELAFYGAPIRSWVELWRVEPAPPLPRYAFHKVSIDVRVPSLEELSRVYRLLCRGRVERK